MAFHFISFELNLWEDESVSVCICNAIKNLKKKTKKKTTVSPVKSFNLNSTIVSTYKSKQKKKKKKKIFFILLKILNKFWKNVMQKNLWKYFLLMRITVHWTKIKKKKQILDLNFNPKI